MMLLDSARDGAMRAWCCDAPGRVLERRPRFKSPIKMISGGDVC